MQNKRPLKEIAALFFKLGSIAFGGPAAHIAMMEDEVVKKRGWMTHEHFLDLIGATNLIPGPNSTEMTMHCGYEQAGWKGLLIAGASFILPAVVITAVFAWLYQKFGHLPNVEPFIYGIKPAVIAIILSAIYTLGKKALKTTTLGVLGALTLTASLMGVHEIVALFACGGAGMLLYAFKKKRSSVNGFFPLLLIPVAGQTVSNLKILFTFLKVGALLYGSGYVLFAFLDAELVMKGFLSRQELIDAIAVGQFTPGPVLSTATFIGWQMGGFWGAIAATVGIFLPSFLFVALLNPVIPRLRKSGAMSAFLDAVNIAAVAVIISVTVSMGRETLTNWRGIVIAVAGIIILLKFKRINSAWLVLGGALAGYLLLQI